MVCDLRWLVSVDEYFSHNANSPEIRLLNQNPNFLQCQFKYRVRGILSPSYFSCVNYFQSNSRKRKSVVLYIGILWFVNLIRRRTWSCGTDRFPPLSRAGFGRFRQGWSLTGIGPDRDSHPGCQTSRHRGTFNCPIPVSSNSMYQTGKYGNTVLRHPLLTDV